MKPMPRATSPLIALFVLLLSWSANALAEPSLQVQLKKTSGELGRPVYLKIIGQGLKTDLSLLSLQSLNKQFVLDTKDLDTEMLVDNKAKNSIHGVQKATPVRRQTLSLKLYPRQTGELLIAPLSIDKISSHEHKIVISDAHTRGEEISFDWRLSPSEVWQREQIIVSLTVTTPEQYAIIKLDKQSINGFEITPLPVDRRWQENSHGGKSVIRAGWSLLPLKTGRTILDLPAIQYHLNGVIRRVFYLPEINLNIRPLPSYLPPTIAVGKISVESSVEPAGRLKKDELAYWNVSIASKSLTPYWLPPVLRQIKSSNNIQFFPAASKRSMQPDSKGPNAIVTHSIPFKPLNNGLTELPEISIQYFNPEAGRLESVAHQAEKPITTGRGIRILLILGLLLLLIYMWKVLYRYIHRRIQYKLQRKHALMRIQLAETKEDVLTGLRLAGKAEGWPENISLSYWLKRWQAKYRTGAQLEKSIQLLSGYYYGRLDENKLKSITPILIDELKTPGRC